MNKSAIKVGLFGLGTVGGGVAELLLKEEKRMQQLLGIPLVLARACDINLDLGKDLPEGIFTTRAADIINDPEIDIVVELIGGTGVAREIVTNALNAGKPVVTANKALLATHGNEVFALSRQKGVKIAFEASVGGGIPLIRSLREGLAANQINRCLGILNGTCNYILTRMTEEGADFNMVLKDAQRLGFAEADPTFDIEGMDTAHKLAVLAALATGRLPRLQDISVKGITEIDAQDIAFAGKIGFVIKLLAVYQRHGEQAELRVHPALVDKKHLLGSVNGPFNAVFVNGDWVGNVMLYGAGAGRNATASAVMGDVLELAREIASGCSLNVTSLGRYSLDNAPLKLIPLSGIKGKHYFRFAAKDKPGVLASIAAVLGKYDISIETVLQMGRQEKVGDSVPIIVLTHETNEQAVQNALLEINALDTIVRPTKDIKVIE